MPAPASTLNATQNAKQTHALSCFLPHILSISRCYSGLIPRVACPLLCTRPLSSSCRIASSQQVVLQRQQRLEDMRRRGHPEHAAVQQRQAVDSKILSALLWSVTEVADITSVVDRIAAALDDPLGPASAPCTRALLTQPQSRRGGDAPESAPALVKHTAAAQGALQTQCSFLCRRGRTGSEEAAGLRRAVRRKSVGDPPGLRSRPASLTGHHLCFTIAKCEGHPVC